MARCFKGNLLAKWAILVSSSGREVCSERPSALRVVLVVAMALRFRIGGGYGGLAVALFAMAGPGAGAAGAAERPPNIVLILADDVGWSDLACYGADLHETPNLDRLATEGIRFTQAYAASVCSPTRAALMTGKHYARLGITIWREAALRPQPGHLVIPPASVADLPLAERTLAEVLRDAGYLTFHVGKWHLGDAVHYPEAQGFGVNIGGTHWGAPATHFHPFRGDLRQGEIRYVPGLGIGAAGDELTDRLTDEALGLIDSAGDRPYFLNLWYHAAHTPIEAKEDLVVRYRAKLAPRLRHQNPTYAAMIHTLDYNVGRVLARLSERELAANTLVVFLSDNGGYVNEFRGQTVTNNHPLRSGKGSLYEGGIRVPLIVRLPGAGRRAAAVCAEPVTVMDLFPTILDLAKVARPEEGLDGVSLAPLLTRPDAKPPVRDLYFHFPHYYPTTTPASAIRSGADKLIEYFEGGRIELYRLDEDPCETTDLATRTPATTARLQAKLAAWRRQVNARLPSHNPDE